MSNGRQTAVEALRYFGHTPTKALEIAIDAERGDYHAKQWVSRAISNADFENFEPPTVNNEVI